MYHGTLSGKQDRSCTEVSIEVAVVASDLFHLTQPLRNLFAYTRKNSRDILDDSESSSAESSDDDLDLLLLDAVCCFAEPQRLGPRLNLEDVGEIECEPMFR